jgi:molybdopterin molybdotransferase
VDGGPLSWSAARAAAYAAGRAAMPDPVDVALAGADGLILAAALTTLTDLPAFPTSSVDGYATRGPGPWPVVGRVLAGGVADPIEVGQAVEIATGAMVPAGTEQILRSEDSAVGADGRITGTARPIPEWRETGDEAAKGEELFAAGTPITPALIGLASACGYDTVPVIPAPLVGVVISGDELLTSGPPGHGRVRDSLGPQVPAWLRRLGALPVPGLDPRGPIEDTLDAHVAALKLGLEQADLVCTTGGTMHGPVDHLHPALAALGARYLANTVEVRPGFPMLVAEIPGAGPGGRSKFVAGLPGNPQSAIVALVSLVVPLLAGLAGHSEPALGQVTLAEPVPGRGDFTHLALVRTDPSGLAYPLPHAGSAMLRGLARADGFAVIQPGTEGRAGSAVPFAPLPLCGGRP